MQVRSGSRPFPGAYPMVAAVATALIGMVVLAGWTLDISVLRSLRPGWVTMKANTAEAFVLAGASLWLLLPEAGARPPGRARLGRACATGVALIGALSLSQDLFGWDLGIDQMVFTEPADAVGTAHPGRMAPATALNFVLLGGALLALDAMRPASATPPQALAIAAALMALLAVAGYLYGVEPLTGFAAQTKMAFHTSVTFLVLSAAILLARPKTGLVAAIASPSLGGAMARRVMPLLVFFPLLFSWLRFEGQERGLYSTEFGIALVAVASAALAVSVIWWSADSLNRSDEMRSIAEQDLSQFFALSTDMLTIAGFDGRLKRINAAWTATLGYTQAELLATPYLDLVHPDDREASAAAEASVTIDGNTVLEFENRYRAADGSHKWVMWSAVPFPERELVFGAGRDVTERKAQEAALEQRTKALAASNAELDAFTYSVAHDLKEPLRTIEGFSRFLLEDYADRLDETGQGYLQRVSQASVRMGELISGLLQLSRIGRDETSITDVEIETVIATIQADMASSIAATEADIALDGELPAVRANETHIRQLFTNLIGNALKFRGEGHPIVRIGVRGAAADRATFYVRDNGIGIAPEYHDQIFGVFRRLNRREEYEGVGAGLSIVKRVVEQHGGAVWVESDEGTGTTFLFTLPLVSAPTGTALKDVA